MKFDLCTDIQDRPAGDVLVIPYFESDNGPVLSFDDPYIEEISNAAITMKDFKAKPLEIMLIYSDAIQEKRIALLGLGPYKDISLESMRKAAGNAQKLSGNKSWPSMTFMLPKHSKYSSSDTLKAIVEGFSLSSYGYNIWKTSSVSIEEKLEKVTFVGDGKKKTIEQTCALISGVNYARELVNANANLVTPKSFPEKGRDLAKQYSKVKCSALDAKDLEKEGMNLLLAVGQGSSIPPTLTVIEYNGAPGSKEKTMIVGKGISFDTGGLNLKPTNHIEDMRCDMGGGAAAVGIIKAVAELEMEINLVSIIPSAENAISSDSYKPGDVFMSHSGISVEITNTDAEGRLVLADALSFGQKMFSPTRIIDLATLTGAIVIALGDTRSGYYSNDDNLAKICYSAGEKTGEKVWRMPLDKEYKELMKSEIADIRNCGKKRLAGSVTAAIFLQEFIKNNTPWIHLDIAGTAFLDSPTHYHSTRATGVGVRLLTELLTCIK